MTDKRIVVHVGLPVTGATLIQGFLTDHREQLATEGFLFPFVSESGSGLPNYQADLLRALHRKFTSQETEQCLEKWQETIDAFIGNERLHTLLISHEAFGMGGDMIDFDRLCRMFRGLPVEVIVFLRGAEDWLAALYEQNVKAGRMKDLPGNYAHAKRYIRQGFEGYLRDIEANFPGAAIQVVAFDAAKKAPGVVPAFLEAILAPDEIASLGAKAQKFNERVPIGQIAVLRALTDMAVPAPVFALVRRYMTRANVRRGGLTEERVRVFPEPLGRQIAKRYEADRTFVRNYFGTALPQSEPPPDAAEDPMRLSADRMDRIIEQLRAARQFENSEAEQVLLDLRSTLG